MTFVGEMLRKTSAILALALLCAMLSGCDFLRTVAGRPTSSELSAKAERIREEEAQEEARAQAEAAARRYTADSLAAEAYFAQEPHTRMTVSQVRILDRATVPAKYSIVVGAFSQAGNASAFVQKLADMGYTAAVMKYNNGHEVVGVCPTDDVVELARMYPKVRAEKFCPAEAWILVDDNR